MLSLDKTTENVPYTVTDIALDSAIKEKLMRLGLMEGTCIRRVLTAPSGDPSAYLIRGARIAIRNAHAKQISVTEARGRDE